MKPATQPQSGERERDGGVGRGLGRCRWHVNHQQRRRRRRRHTRRQWRRFNCISACTSFHFKTHKFQTTSTMATTTDDDDDDDDVTNLGLAGLAGSLASPRSCGWQCGTTVCKFKNFSICRTVGAAHKIVKQKYIQNVYVYLAPQLSWSEIDDTF